MHHHRHGFGFGGGLLGAAAGLAIGGMIANSMAP